MKLVARDVDVWSSCYVSMGRAVVPISHLHQRLLQASQPSSLSLLPTPPSSHPTSPTIFHNALPSAPLPLPAPLSSSSPSSSSPPPPHDQDVINTEFDIKAKGNLPCRGSIDKEENAILSEETRVYAKDGGTGGM